LIHKGTWVKIQLQVLDHTERAPQLPDDTKKVPFIMWTKGFLTEDAELNSVVTVKTLTGRNVTGTLMEIEPAYLHDYGKFVPELIQIGATLRKERWGGDWNE
jgi:2-amino-4-ketopentanoate thiolase alpha subunit